MDVLKFDLSKKTGKFKPMNAVNGAPVKPIIKSMLRSNMEAWKAARIPYARNHDYATVHRGHAVDISGIFPNPDANPHDTRSYDFALTDLVVEHTFEAGTETFYRLGQTIENWPIHYHVYPPKDYKQWAITAEHIIRHYNEGWNNGFEYGIKYWEIWNEPDGTKWQDPAYVPSKSACWVGSYEQFFEFYATVAKHLKKCFPHLKIGGPAIVGRLPEWVELFLKYMREHDVEIDFFSWHIYTTEPTEMLERAKWIKELLVKYGYDKTESILDEWNYRINWTDRFLESMEKASRHEGAAFNLAVMTACQHSSIDMLMYYDTRQTTCFCGLFDLRTLRPTKAYYSFLWYGKYYDMEAEVLCENEVPELYPLCGIDKEGKTLTSVAYFTNREDAEEKTVQLDFGKSAEYNVYLVDEDHIYDLIEAPVDLIFTLKPNSCLFLEEK